MPAGPVRDAAALRFELIDFVDHELVPIEAYYLTGATALERLALLADLRAEARRRELWAVLLPSHPVAAALDEAQRSALADELARSRLGAAVCGCGE